MRTYIYNTIKTTFSLFDHFVGLLAPHDCLACAVEGSLLCSDCLDTAGDQIVPRCAGCKNITNKWLTCAACRPWLRAKAVYVATNYEGIYEKLIKSYKFDVKRQAAIPIAIMMYDVSVEMPRYDVICPLPTAPSRVRLRGFDHAALLAREYSRLSSVPVVSLLRRSSNSRQLGATRSQRLKQMQHEFYVNNPADVDGKTVVLIDDVMTTGASISAASVELLDAGAKSVYVVVFAQKL